ncbi:MAG: DSD1 family PLP-dependent enzyme [Proteobacteria bacterium]|nr:DSD1 family PLP-dependent enzyme [Pseudomonadota bacterium]
MSAAADPRTARNARWLGRSDAWQQLETPALCIDLAALEYNIEHLARWARGAGVGLRPHVKTHKCQAIARLQRAAGALGVCAATLAEAEQMVVAEVGSVLLTSPVVGAAKLQRLQALHAARPGQLLAVVDTPAAVAELAALAASTGRPLGVLLEHHAGQRRSGCETRAELGELAAAVARSPQLVLRGVQHYFGHLQHVADPAQRRTQVLAAAAELRDHLAALRAEGVALEIVSGGGTGTLLAAAEAGVYTELQAGSYVFMDAQYEDVLGEDTMLEFHPALYVAARVTSVQSAAARGCVTLDAGQKALSIDPPGPRLRGGGAARGSYAFFGDEHGRWLLPAGAPVPARGARVDLTPGHCDPTVVLHDAYHVFRGGELVAIWPVDARGY